MQPSGAYTQSPHEDKRRRVLTCLIQPMTATQLSRLTGLDLDPTMKVVRRLVKLQFLRCLNPQARRSRLYWLTTRRAAYSERFGSARCDHQPSIDWDLYGWVCYSHRAAILKALTHPLQPCEIKRKARFDNPALRMSANNVRDVIRLFVVKGIVRSVRGKRRAHTRYELTTLGDALRTLLLRAELVWEAGSDLSKDHIHKGDTSM